MDVMRCMDIYGKRQLRNEERGKDARLARG